jgi:hypothetical protein
LITSSIIIIHHFFVLSRTNKRKSLLLFFIPSIKTKSYFSFNLGITSRAFHKIGLIKSSTFAFLKFSKASQYDLGEKSIVVIFHFPCFLSSKAKFIVENPFAVHISSMFLAFFIFIKSLRNFAFVKLIFGISLFIQCFFNSSKNLFSFIV